MTGYRHGGYGTPTHGTWRSMIRRCTDQGSKSWPRYGGRGITVCSRWLDFAAFREDMGERPDGMTLDRIDTTGNYEPANCRWATVVEQNRNKRPERLRPACRRGHEYRPGTWRWRTDSSRRARRCLICKSINEGRVAA